MNVLDLTCKNSVSFSQNRKKSSQTLYVGGVEDFISCLYFEIPPHIYGKVIESARLILYKYPVSAFEQYNSKYGAAYKCSAPCDDSHDDCCPANLIVCPLLEFFSKYSPCYSIPRTDAGKTVICPIEERLCYTEIDISQIAKQWIQNTLDNRGLLLKGCCTDRIVSYASEKEPDGGLRPTMRLTYRDPGQLSCVPCIVSVNNAQ